MASLGVGSIHWVGKWYNRPVLPSYPFYSRFPPPSHMLKGVDTSESLSPTPPWPPGSGCVLLPLWDEHDRCIVPMSSTVSVPKLIVSRGESQGDAKMGWLCLGALGGSERQVCCEEDCGSPPAFLSASPLFPPFLPVSFLASLSLHPQTLTKSLLCASSSISW